MYGSLKEFKSAARSILFGKIFIALVLIAVGLWATYIIITVVYMLFTDLSAIPFIGNLLSYPNDIKVISLGGDGLSMSGSIVAYIIAILLLSFGGRFTYKIIKLGVDLVSKLDMKFFYEKLWKEEEKIDKSVEDSIIL
ncbi:MAG: hypothetical protein K8R54_13590 [Bacteroidales bacterium]|nr:hypothetical protein [Bacteroidales bacterium]